MQNANDPIYRMGIYRGCDRIDFHNMCHILRFQRILKRADHPAIIEVHHAQMAFIGLFSADVKEANKEEIQL